MEDRVLYDMLNDILRRLGGSPSDATSVHHKLDELLRRVGGNLNEPPMNQPPVNVAIPPPMVGPGIVKIAGMLFDLKEPVSADWVPAESEFGRNGGILSEPSNAPTGHPRRSPRGYPLYHPGVRWDGYGTPMGPPKIMYGAALLDDDGPALQAHKDALAEAAANNARAPGFSGR